MAGITLISRMKTAFPLLLAPLLLLNAPFAEAQVPDNHPKMPRIREQTPPPAPVANPKSISLKVREVATKKQDVDRYRGYYYSDRDTYRQKTVEVEIRNLGGVPIPKGKLWVLWIAKVNEPGAQPFVFHRDEKEVSVTQLSEKVLIDSPSVKENNISDYWYNGSYHSTSGARLQGYIIGLDFQGESVAPYASSAVKSIATPEKIEELNKNYAQSGSSTNRDRR